MDVLLNISILVRITLLVYFFIRYAGTKIKPKHYLILLLFSAAATIGSVQIESYLVVMLFQYAILLILGGILKTTPENIILPAVIVIEITYLSAGLFDTVSGMLTPTLFSSSLDQGLVNGLIFSLGLVFPVVCSIPLYLFADKMLGGEQRINDKLVFLVLLPLLLIQFVEYYISAAVYGNIITLDAAGTYTGAAGAINHGQIFLLHCFGILSLLGVIYSYRRLLDGMWLQSRVEGLKQETEFQKKYVEQAEYHYQSTKSFRHDYKNHITILKGLLEQTEYDRATAYLTAINDTVTELSFPWHTNHAILDILIGSKLDRAGRNGIKTSCELIIPSACCVADMDFCIVFANALDNAINACEQAVNPSEKYIHISGQQQGDFLMAEIVNGCSMSGEKIKESTGIANIRAVADKYLGAVDIEYSRQKFRLSILFVVLQQEEGNSQQIS